MKWIVDVLQTNRFTKEPFWKRVWWDATEEQAYIAGCIWLLRGYKIRIKVKE